MWARPGRMELDGRSCFLNSPAVAVDVIEKTFVPVLFGKFLILHDNLRVRILGLDYLSTWIATARHLPRPQEEVTGSE